MKHASCVAGVNVSKVGPELPARRARRSGLLLGVAATVLVGFEFSPPAYGQVSCTNPDNLCTGDPCVIDTTIEVVSPCVADFGARKLIIRRIIVPDTGVLSLTAATIEVKHGINGRHSNPGGKGANISLIATGDMVIRRPLVASGNATAGTILLDAGGNIELRGVLRSKPAGRAPTAMGGIVRVQAAGTLSVTPGARVEVFGRKTEGGQAILRGQMGVTLKSRVKAQGSRGGSVEVSSRMGAVSTSNKISAAGLSGVGGSVLVSASADATIADSISAKGTSNGGSIQVSSAAGAVIINSTLNARGQSGTGGIVALTGSSVVTVNYSIGTSGRATGGTIQVSSPAGAVTINGGVDADTSSGLGGTVTVDAGGPVMLNASVDAAGRIGGGSITVDAGGPVTARGSLEADGRTGGGSISVFSASGPVTVGRGLSADGDSGAGGNLAVIAAGEVTVDGPISATGSTGGSVQVFGSSVTVTDSIAVDGDDDGGSIAVSSGLGDVTISDRLRARGRRGTGGIIVVNGGNNITVSRTIDAIGKNGGSVDLSAAAVLTARQVLASGDSNGGNLNFQGASAVLGPSSTFDVHGSTMGGQIRCRATTSDLSMSGSLLATGGGGVIEGLAPTGNLVAEGTFQVSPGCIGLSAGGTLDTTGATFDVPLAPSCP